MILPITLTIAGAAALINFWLSIRIAQLRERHKVLIGDGGVPGLTARMRAQANFIEYTPLFIILVGLIELARGSSPWLWSAALAFMAGRLLHPFGMDRMNMNRFRQAGMLLTMLPMLALAIWGVVLPYLDTSTHAAGTMIPAAHAAMR